MDVPLFSLIFMVGLIPLVSPDEAGFFQQNLLSVSVNDQPEIEILTPADYERPIIQEDGNCNFMKFNAEFEEEHSSFTHFEVKVRVARMPCSQDSQEVMTMDTSGKYQLCPYLSSYGDVDVRTCIHMCECGEDVKCERFRIMLKLQSPTPEADENLWKLLELSGYYGSY